MNVTFLFNFKNVKMCTKSLFNVCETLRILYLLIRSLVHDSSSVLTDVTVNPNKFFIFTKYTR